MAIAHQPVMLKEAVSSLNLKPGCTVLDATLGGGGHAVQILDKISPGGTLIGLDADPAAIVLTRLALKDSGAAFKLVNENFRNLDVVMAREGVKSLDAAIFDVGISSYQIEDGSRGFSIRHDARIDMRMDPRAVLSAYDIVNRYKEKDLAQIIRQFGEERFYRRIARRIVEARAVKPIETTQEFSRVVRGAIGSRRGKMKIDPATRTFQAIRIAVNDELGALEEGLKKAVSWLGQGARICVISFHSLEDRIVKNLFKGYAQLGILRIVTKKPLTPSRDEIFLNPRSRSAKLRVAERI